MARTDADRQTPDQDSDEDLPQDGDEDLEDESRDSNYDDDHDPDDDDEHPERDHDEEDDEEDSTGRQDADDEPEPDQDTTRYITVKDPRDGTEKRITESEAAAGWMRTADYTRKTMAAAERARQADALIQQYTGQVERVGKILDEALDPKNEPDWAKLKEENPEQYLIARDEWRELKAAKAANDAELKRVADEKARKDQAQFEAHLQAEHQKLLDRLPEWRDPKTARREAAVIRRGLHDAGFSDEEIGLGLTDHRTVLLIRDALRYREITRGRRGRDKAKPVPPGRTLRPGAPKTPSESGDARKAHDRLERTGSVRDAADVLRRMPGLFEDGKRRR